MGACVTCPDRPAHATSDAGTAGCGRAPGAAGDFHVQTTDGTGAARDYEVIVPSPLPTTPLALTFVYHGAGGTEAVAKGFGLQSAPGAAASSIFVFPQGVSQGGTVGWNDACGAADMAFFDNMLAYLEANYCVDPTRVFAAGFSWGCDFVTGLTCCRGDRIHAVGAASCSDDFSNPASYLTYINQPCPASGHTAIRFTVDPNGDSAYSAQQFQTTNNLYRSFNSCSSSATTTTSSACVSYGGCKNPYLECTYPGLGHALPPGWASDTWSFFAVGSSTALPALGNKAAMGAAVLLLTGFEVLRRRRRKSAVRAGTARSG